MYATQAVAGEFAASVFFGLEKTGPFTIVKRTLAF